MLTWTDSIKFFFLINALDLPLKNRSRFSDFCKPSKTHVGCLNSYSLLLSVLYSTYDVCYVSCVLPLKLPFVDFCSLFSNIFLYIPWHRDCNFFSFFFLKWKVPWTSVDTNAVKRMQTTWQNRRDKKCLLWQGNFLKYFACHFSVQSNSMVIPHKQLLKKNLLCC